MLEERFGINSAFSYDYIRLTKAEGSATKAKKSPSVAEPKINKLENDKLDSALLAFADLIQGGMATEDAIAHTKRHHLKGMLTAPA